MREVHEEICGNHSGARSLVHKLVRAGYYWPTIQKDAQIYVKACNKCQRFGNVIRQLSEELTPHDGPMVIHSMGIRYHEPLPDNIQVAKVLSGWHQLPHQMGGSRSPSHYHGKEYSKFCLEEHHL